MARMEQFWAYYEVNLHSILYDAWSELDTEVPEYYAKEVNPHITIHPRFQFEKGEEERFRHYVYDTFPQSIQVKINSFYYHPDEYKPMVICFDIETNIPFRKKQSDLEDKIRGNGGKNVLETAPPHITVYKSKDARTEGGRRIPSNVTDIQTRCQKVANRTLPITVKDTKLRIEKGG